MCVDIKNSCVLLHEVQHPTGEANTPETPDPVTEVETAMTIGAVRQGRLLIDEGDQVTGIATAKIIALPDTPAAAEATAGVAVVAIDGVAITDKKVERS